MKLVPLAGCLLLVAVARAAPLEKIENCTLVETPWADGDSFLVKTPAGQEMTLRLYGADCIEWHVTDRSDEDRLRTQRRYFGITEINPDLKRSIELAKGFGEQAAQYVKTSLSQPFTVYTAHADARGDGRYKRVYAFVVSHQGQDIASELVAKGLARAFGVYRETWQGWSQSEYRAYMEGLELRAASSRAGIWAHTNWNSLPEERRIQWSEDEKIALAIDKAPSISEGEEINPNTAARDDLMRLPGIGETYANRIIENRPYAAAEDLMNVPGIGPSKLEKLLPYLKFSEN